MPEKANGGIHRQNLLMENLYIICNGFDLHHGLKTSYNDFKHYLKEISDGSVFLSTLDNYFDSENLWSNFEESLGEVNLFDYIAVNLSDIEYIPDYSKDLSIDFVNALNNYLCQWILSIDINKNIPSSYHLPINSNSFFLSFNYTNTLEICYKIKNQNIIYLHGKCEENKHKNTVYRNPFETFKEKNYSNLIIGHNNKELFLIEECYNKFIENFVPEFILESMGEKDDKYYNKEYFLNNYINEKTIKFTIEQLNIYQNKMQKDHIRQIRKYKDFFKDIKKFDRIIILGHSLGDVDYEYFKAIFNTISNNTQIIISYFDNKSCECLKKQIIKLGFDKEINFIELKNIPYYT